MCPRVPIAADRHRNGGNEYPVLRRVADPVYPRERRPCGLDVDEQALETHCGLHTAREEICSHQQHNHTSIHDQSSRGRSCWSLAHGHVCKTLRLQGPQREGTTCLCMPQLTDIVATTRVLLMVTIMAIARGGLSWEIKGATNPHSIIAILSVGWAVGPWYWMYRSFSVSIMVHSQCLSHANHACHIKRRDNIGMFNGSC